MEISMELQVWKEILSPYELAVDELVLKLNHVIREHSEKGIYCPIEQVNGRVKSISSILAKANNKNIPIEDITKRIEDIAGIRIMCQFVEDISKVVEYLCSRSDMEIWSEVDYITKPKESGYRSYHMVIHYQVQTSFETKVIPVEIQIRTLAMNFWAVIEHSLQYKYQRNIPSHIRKRLMASAEAVLSLDNEMASIRDEILEAQTSFRKKASIVHDILETISNLSKVASSEEVISMQQEFFQLYNEGDMDILKSFSLKLDRMVKEYTN